MKTVMATKKTEIMHTHTYMCACMHVHVCMFVCLQQKCTHEISMRGEVSLQRNRHRGWNVDGEENYFQVNSPHCDWQFGLQTGPKHCRCKVTTLAASLLMQGKHSRRRRGHSARCAKSYQQTGSGSESFRVGGMQCVYVCESKLRGWKK